MLASTLIRLVALTAGAGLSLFLIVSWLGKKKFEAVDWLLVLTLTAATFWYGFQAMDLYLGATLDRPSDELQTLFGLGRQLGAWTLPALLAHLALVWLGTPAWAGVFGYLAALVAWVASQLGVGQAAAAYCAGCLLVVVAVAPPTVGRQTEFVRKRFHKVFAAAVALALVSGLRGSESALFVLASVLPTLCLLWFVRRFNLFGILVGRRTIFVFTLAAVSALYLFAVRRIADFVELEVGAFGALVEVALIFGAAVIWIPLYEWITRYFSRRGDKYAEFSKDIVERASRVLDMKHRLEFLSEQTGKLFLARRVLIWRSLEPTEHGACGYVVDSEAAANIDLLLACAREKTREVIHALRTDDSTERSVLRGLGFNYAFPLWYENHLTGLLLVDTSPRQYLDEDEPILLALSRQISYSIAACRMVEEKIHLEKALLRQEHLASVGQLTATIAHEVKNPLSSIKTLAQLMREDRGLGPYQRDLDYIVAETDRLNSCVSQLLSYSRPLPVESPRISVYELLEATVGSLQRDCATRQVSIDSEIAPVLREYRADRQTLQQIVLNLTLNAVQASPEGGTVRFRASAVPPQTVQIDVSDEGPGIPPELQEKIFEPFFTTKQKGSGLGLSIVRKNLRQLQGDIHVVSPATDGCGTRFTVTFPAERASEA